MNTTKVSIVIPLFRAEKYLTRVVTALKWQTLQDIEMILVDDGSDDLSSGICDKFVADDTRIIVVHSSNYGVSNARNIGIKIAKSEYIMFCDSDDVPNRMMAEKLYARATEEQADSVLCSFVKITKENSIEDSLPFTVSFTEKQEILDHLVMPMLVWGYAPERQRYPVIYGSVWRVLFRADKVRNHNIHFDPEIRLGEDMLFNEAFWPICNKISFVDEPLYQYIENPSSATHTNYEIMWRQYVSTWEKAHIVLYDLNAGLDRLQWHNYQLTRYAISAIIEGVCSQQLPNAMKVQQIKSILEDDLLRESRRNLPRTLGRKERLLCALMRPPFAMLMWAYYQRKASVSDDTRIQ